VHRGFIYKNLLAIAAIIWIIRIVRRRPTPQI
jgi:hypothetical protein